ncbi:MAG TPA: type II secretion system protein [Tepidisphaeraceae bacterium]|jgi:type II secretory pathway pseudopilin PulG
MKTQNNNSIVRRCKRRLGFTMVESVMLVSILGVTAGVVGQSLTTMANSAEANNLNLEINDQLMAQMEVLRSTYTTATPAPTSSTPWTKSTPVTLSNGKTYTLNSTIAWADPGQGSTQSNFLQLQVTLGNQAMSTYVSQ